MKEYLEIGKIVGTHGIRGEVRVEPWCDGPEFFKKFKILYLNLGEKAIEVQSVKIHKTGAILKLSGIDTVESAQEMRGKMLYISRKDAHLPIGSYFIEDIIGLSVVNEDDATEVFGTVSDVMSTGANDVYEVTTKENKKYLIPAVSAIVKKTDIQNGILYIHPIGGLFDDED